MRTKEHEMVNMNILSVSRIKHSAWFLYLLLICCTSHAAIDSYEFNDAEQQERFNTLIHELRCPKCQNQTLADSDAPLAKDLRGIVYEQVRAGHKEGEIVAYLKERYGDFIWYRPPLNASTWFLWLGPFLLLFFGLAVMVYKIKRRAKPSIAENI